MGILSSALYGGLEVVAHGHTSTDIHFPFLCSPSHWFRYALEGKEPAQGKLALCGQLKEKCCVDISKSWLLSLLASMPAFSLVCSMQIWNLVFHLEFCLGLNPNLGNDTAKCCVKSKFGLKLELNEACELTLMLSHTLRKACFVSPKLSQTKVLYSWCKIRVTAVAVFTHPLMLISKHLRKENL